MTRKSNRKEEPYKSDRDTKPSKQTGNINSHNNNTSVSAPGPNETTVENVSDEGIGDKALNDRKLTGYTSNHSEDA
jgi:hypothetical protein